MSRIKIKKLIWDEYNIEHIKKHNVTIKEVEEAIENFIAHKQAVQGRYIAMGRVGPRLISIVVKRIEPGSYYPISARDSSKKERQAIYEKEKI